MKAVMQFNAFSSLCYYAAISSRVMMALFFPCLDIVEFGMEYELFTISIGDCMNLSWSLIFNSCPSERRYDGFFNFTFRQVAI